MFLQNHQSFVALISSCGMILFDQHIPRLHTCFLLHHRLAFSRSLLPVSTSIPNRYSSLRGEKFQMPLANRFHQFTSNPCSARSPQSRKKAGSEACSIGRCSKQEKRLGDGGVADWWRKVNTDSEWVAASCWRYRCCCYCGWRAAWWWSGRDSYDGCGDEMYSAGDGDRRPDGHRCRRQPVLSVLSHLALTYVMQWGLTLKLGAWRYRD